MTRYDGPRCRSCNIPIAHGDVCRTHAALRERIAMDKAKREAAKAKLKASPKPEPWRKRRRDYLKAKGATEPV